MKNLFTQTGFELEATLDGSPTLQMKSQGGEKMHHSGGAASETRYIYASVMEKAYRIKPELRTCVVGLGLGYIEISWAQVLEKLKLEVTLKQRDLISYEIDKELISNYRNWLQSEEATGNNVYSSILKHLDANSSLSQVKKYLLHNYKLNPIRGDLLQDESQDRNFHVICFDAFSRKANEDLWSYDFLKSFIKSKCHEDCVFTTYACTGDLKKVLKDENFTVILRPGFQGKRDSTLALRGRFKAFESSFRIF